MPRNTGASLEHYALCRCGQSQNKPFCSGMHWYVGFRDPVPEPGREPTLFEWAGGLPALTRMTRLLYEKHVPADPLLAPLFADMPPGSAGAAGRLAGRGARRAARPEGGEFRPSVIGPPQAGSPRSSGPGGRPWPARPPMRPGCRPTRRSVLCSRPV